MAPIKYKLLQTTYLAPATFYYNGYNLVTVTRLYLIVLIRIRLLDSHLAPG